MTARIECPACASARAEPLRMAAVAGGVAHARLRCAECCSCWCAALDDVALRELDRRQREGRSALLAAYEESVSASMTALADALGAALERDLLGPEDFPRRPEALS